MAYGQNKQNISVPASVELVGQENKLVTLAGALATKGALAFPLENDMAQPDGEPCALTTSGVAPVLYGGTVAQGDPLASNASGLAVVATAGDSILGYAMEAGAASNLGTMLVLPNGKVPAGT